VVHQDVEAVELGQGGHDDLAPCRFVGYVVVAVERPAALAADLGRDGLAGLVLDVGDEHGRALLGEPEGGGAPDPAGPTGHQCDSSVQPVHGWVTSSFSAAFTFCLTARKLSGVTETESIPARTRNRANSGSSLGRCPHNPTFRPARCASAIRRSMLSVT